MCSHHFLPDQIKSSGLCKRLFPNSLPSLNICQERYTYESSSEELREHASSVSVAKVDQMKIDLSPEVTNTTVDLSFSSPEKENVELSTMWFYSPRKRVTPVEGYSNQHYIRKTSYFT
ncbi:uncharacterized protein LOC123010076 [Tribolium madens]|uniref:uncharacterized protein LOC123010076 n=1 Tax=Tribolium madens TaxID=41895 RepID=UPI001CF7219A|nr:uncharacterized protein LOC123010076 [Tribolium madens]